MPYIEQIKRPPLKPSAVQLGKKAQCAGDLNYIFTEVIHSYLQDKGTNYDKYNSMLGALFACALELYRRQVGPYEDIKIEANGDVGMNDVELPEMTDVDH